MTANNSSTSTNNSTNLSYLNKLGNEYNNAYHCCIGKKDHSC